MCVGLFVGYVRQQILGIVTPSLVVLPGLFVLSDLVVACLEDTADRSHSVMSQSMPALTMR